MRSGSLAWAAALGCLLAVPVQADAPTLTLPLDCVLGQSCYIEDYVDADPTEGQQDYTCGLKSREGHRGTDIGLLSFEAMQMGVNVLAAASGVVDAVRDGVTDVAVTSDNRENIKGQECGNGIRIDHFLLSPLCADMLRDCQIDRDVRGRDKPSDHVPIWVELDI